MRCKPVELIIILVPTFLSAITQLTFSTSVSYPATKKVFEVREYSRQLSENKGELFNSVISKFLFIMNGSRTYLEMTVIFLITRVSKVDVDDREN